MEKFMNKTRIKYIIFSILIIVVSILIGIFSHSELVGIFSMIFGLLNVLFTSEAKWYSYIFGMIYTLLYAYISYQQGLNGVVIATGVFYMPIQIFGLINWKKHTIDNKVETKTLKPKQSLIVCTLIIVLGVVIGYLLNLNSTQKMAFLDSFSQVINIMANIFLILRYRQCGTLWIFAGSIDFVIWLVVLIGGGENGLMMFVIATIYMLMNYYGFYKWHKER